MAEGNGVAPLPALPEEFRQLAEQCDEMGAEALATVWRRAADRLERSLLAYDEELLPIAKAAKECGYTVNGLQRLHREGVIRVRHRSGRRYVRRGDLPRKPGRGVFGALDTERKAVKLG